MQLNIDVKYNINDRVIVKMPHLGAYNSEYDLLGTVIGYVIHKTEKSTKIYYKVTIDKYATCCKNKKYLASELSSYVEK